MKTAWKYRLLEMAEENIKQAWDWVKQTENDPHVMFIDLLDYINDLKRGLDELEARSE